MFDDSSPLVPKQTHPLVDRTLLHPLSPCLPCLGAKPAPRHSGCGCAWGVPV